MATEKQDNKSKTQKNKPPKPQKRSTNELSRCEADIAALAKAIRQGDLSKKCATDYESAALQNIGNHINDILNQLLTPLRAASGALERIAHGNIPEFIIAEYHGEFNQIKKNINNFLATMYGMHYEVNNLMSEIRSGELLARGNDWDFEGIWKSLITGVNSVLDAIVEPVAEASTILEHVSEYDLTTRMTANYRGDHARIKHALNGTIDTLSSALLKVANVVDIVSGAGKNVLDASRSMNEGSERQSQKVKEASMVLETLLEFCKDNTLLAQNASQLSQNVYGNINKEKGRMNMLLTAMIGVKNQAEGTQEIIHAMNDIGNQTDELAVKASTEAVNVTSSSRGFSVVAEQIGRLAQQSQASAKKMYRINKDIKIMIKNKNLDRLSEMVDSLDHIARDINDTSRETKFIAINAAVNSAHVSDAGASFENIVSHIKGLSGQNKDATQKSERLILDSIDMSAKGEKLSHDVNNDLEAIVQMVSKVAELVNTNESSNASQTQGIGEVNKAVSIINDVTEENAAIAVQSEEIAQELARQTQVLSGIVNQFQLRSSEAL